MKSAIKTAITEDEWKAVSTQNSVAKTLHQMRTHVRQVLNGDRLGMFVFGGAGMGKNHIVFDELSKAGHQSQPITPNNVKDLLSEFHNATYDIERGKPRKLALPLVFDEARLIFETQANLNVMKLALDGAKEAKRWHSGYVWFSQELSGFNEETGEEKFRKVRHQGTSLAAPVIAMTNKNLHEFDKKTHDHAEALLSRVPPIMIPDDPIASWEYVVWLALTTDIITQFKGKTLPLNRRVAVIDWFTDNLHNLANVSVRTLEKVRDIFATSSSELLLSDLDLLLKPMAKRTDRQGPRQLDWASLRKALT